MTVVALVLSASLFAIGAAIERHDERSEKRAEPTTERTHQEGGGGESAAEPRASGEQGESAAVHHAESRSERIFGVNPDAPLLVVGAVVVSLLLAVGLWRSSWPPCTCSWPPARCCS
jgi:hypothetical protein